jgi:catechol 2,3-dioxygenase-like lactoylglutathione lyase family enzyme
MARSIAEIKQEIIQYWMGEEVVQRAYGVDAGADFNTNFSNNCIESVKFYIQAVAVWTLEKLFNSHKAEITAIIDELKPHSLRWYVSKAKAFLLGVPLVQDTDYYDTAGMTDEQVKAAQVVKYVSASESDGVVYLKVAGDQGGEPAPLAADTYKAFNEYIAEVKDAGVVIEVINDPAKHFRLQMTVYYNPMVLNEAGVSLADGTTPVVDTIKLFIKSLPFDGEYQNAKLVDALQALDGVVIPELHLAESSEDGYEWTQINAKEKPLSGHYKVYSEDDLNITYVAYMSGE